MINNPILGEEPEAINYPIGFLQAFLPKIITIALVIAVIIFLFVMLLGGISWMTSGGDKSKVEEARAKVTNGIIGLLIVFSVFAILRFTEGLFGINIVELNIGVLKIE